MKRLFSVESKMNKEEFIDFYHHLSRENRIKAIKIALIIFMIPALILFIISNPQDIGLAIIYILFLLLIGSITLPIVLKKAEKVNVEKSLVNNVLEESHQVFDFYDFFFTTTKAYKQISYTEITNAILTQKVLIFKYGVGYYAIPLRLISDEEKNQLLKLLNNKDEYNV